MDGREASRQILAHQREQSVNLQDLGYTTIVFLTSYTHDLIFKEAKKIGVKKVYHKPIKVETLKDMFTKYFLPR